MAHATKPVDGAQIDRTEASASEVDKLVGELQQEEAPRRLLSALSDGMYDYFRLVGVFFLRFVSAVKKRSNSFYQKYLQARVHRLDLFWLRVKKRLSKLYRGAFYRLYLFLKFFSDAFRVVREGFSSHPEKPLPLRCCRALGAFGRGVRNNARIFLTALNYLLPTAAVVGFCFLVGYVSKLPFALSVEYNGQHVGYVEDETVYEQAETKLQERLLYQEGDEVLDNVPRFEVTIADPRQITREASRLTDTIIRSSNADMVQATGIKVDGEFIGAVKNLEPISSTLDSMLDQYRSAGDDKVEFTKSIQMETGLFLQKNVAEESRVLQKLTAQTEQDVYYTAVKGDSPSGIASMYDMATADLVALNPNILTELKIGQQVLVNKSQPYLPVKCVRTEVYTEAVPYETEYVDSSDLYEGMSKTLSEGAEGENSVTAEVAYVDGIELERTVLSTVTVAEPVTRKIAKGTKPMPRVETAVATGARSDMGFINPVQQRNPYVSQGFGRTRYNSGHTGIDIAFRGNGYGTPIVASLPGMVEFAGWRSSYGNLVIINHGGGIKTYYAHCSKLTVSAGQTVAQGQQIANVGSTGRSTGNHCHFMVVINGSYKNPLSYIPGY